MSPSAPSDVDPARSEVRAKKMVPDPVVCLSLARDESGLSIGADARTVLTSRGFSAS